MNALIFSAGLGTRLRPLTNNCPKAMVLLQGKPLLQHCIEELIATNLVTRIVVNVHHFAQQIIDFLAENDFGLPIHLSDERNLLLDTGGGLKKAGSFFDKSEPILLRNVDVLCDIDYQQMLDFHKKNNALATLAVRQRLSSRYLLFDEKNHLSGWKNTKTQEEIIKKPTSVALKNYAFSGIHIVEARLLDLLPEAKNAYSIVPAYLDLCEQNTILGYPHDQDLWLDLGTVERLQQAEVLLKNKKSLE